MDSTAKWCQTCNTIVKPALGSASVRAKLEELDAIARLADYTAFPPIISKELARYGRAGVPVVFGEIGELGWLHVAVSTRRLGNFIPVPRGINGCSPSFERYAMLTHAPAILSLPNVNDVSGYCMGVDVA